MTHLQKGWAGDFAPPADVDFDDLWVPKVVDERLVEAMRVVMRGVGRVGPAGHGNNMPDYYYDWADLWFQAGNKDNSKPRGLSLLSASQEQVTRMEEAIRWPAVYLADHPGPRRVLAAYLRAKAHRYKFSDDCKRRGWPRATAYRARDKALALIAQGLNKDRVTFK